MRLFSEEVKVTSSSSPLNILQVEDFEEIFFGVYEVEINEKRYPVERVSNHEGNPVVDVPVVVDGVEKKFPFVLVKGKQEVLFNPDSEGLIVEKGEVDEDEENIEYSHVDEIDLGEVIEDLIPVENPDKGKIVEEIQRIKKEAIREAQREISKRKRIISENIEREKNEKEKSLSLYLENARENLVNEFILFSNKIKSELVDANDDRFGEISETIDNKINDLSTSLRQSIEEDFSNSSSMFDKTIKQLVNALYTEQVDPKIDKTLTNIAKDVAVKVSDIDKNLNIKLKKVETIVVEGVSKEIDAIRDANIELNNSLNKGLNKALSRVGNVDKKINSITEELERKIEDKENEITRYFDDKLALVREDTLNITDGAREYFKGLIEESKRNLLTEIRKIQGEKPIEYILESKNDGKIVKDWDTIEQDWNKKIHDKFENYKTDLRKYVTVYASGGGTNALQLANGGIIDGDLIITGSLSAGNFSGGGNVNPPPTPNYSQSVTIHDLVSGENSVATFPLETTSGLIQSSFTLVFSTPSSKNTLKFDCVVNGSDVVGTGYAVINSGVVLYSSITPALLNGYLVLNIVANAASRLTVVGSSVYVGYINNSGSVLISEDGSILISEDDRIFVAEN
jgi:hypothetical protein